jgi:hypothetical protein
VLELAALPDKHLPRHTGGGGGAPRCTSASAEANTSTLARSHNLRGINWGWGGRAQSSGVTSGKLWLCLTCFDACRSSVYLLRHRITDTSSQKRPCRSFSVNPGSSR